MTNDFGLENKEVKGIMRAIMFRGLRKKYNQDWHKSKWKYGNLLNSENIGQVGANLDSYEYAEVIPETVGEFTGLKDKNGKEIYEGDIVNAVQNYHGKPSSIMFNAKIIYNDNIGSFMISYKNINDVFVNDEIWLRYFLEVIGNIHENPELL